MTHEEFFDALKRGEIAPAYFFHGEEEHVKASALEALRARLLPAGLEALNETALQNPAAAVVVAAALLNALKVVGKTMETAKVVINGAGSAGVAIGKHLMNLGVKDLIMVDRFGILCEGMEGLNPAHEEMSRRTNPRRITGTLADAMRGADVFIGVSAPGVVTREMVASMNTGACVFPMANPVPEIHPDEALAAGAAVVGSGRSDYKNQINNVLAFPGIFRGARDCRAKDINEAMKVAASYAIAGLVAEDELSADYIIPKAFDKRVGPAVAEAVAKAARETGAARI